MLWQPFFCWQKTYAIALHIAIVSRNYDCFRRLVESPAIDINRSENGYTPLVCACRHACRHARTAGDSISVKFVKDILVFPNADVNAIHTHGEDQPILFTALYQAVSVGVFEIVEVLLADPRVLIHISGYHGNYYYDPVVRAVHNRRWKMIPLFLKREASRLDSELDRCQSFESVVGDSLCEDVIKKLLPTFLGTRQTIISQPMVDILKKVTPLPATRGYQIIDHILSEAKLKDQTDRATALAEVKTFLQKHDDISKFQFDI